MKTTTELLQELNNMQTNHIKVLEERIEVISQHRQHLNETISNQAEQLQTSYTRIELGKEAKSIDDNTIGKLFAAAKKDKERINTLKHSIEIDKITMQTQEKTIKLYTEYLKSK